MCPPDGTYVVFRGSLVNTKTQQVTSISGANTDISTDAYLLKETGNSDFPYVFVDSFTHNRIYLDNNPNEGQTKQHSGMVKAVHVKNIFHNGVYWCKVRDENDELQYYEDSKFIPLSAGFHSFYRAVPEPQN